jgi:hypothetical protein
VTPDISTYMSDASGGWSMLPSLFASEENARPWSVARAVLYGTGMGLLAALIKLFGPFHPAQGALPFALEIGVAVLTFAILCTGAALLRNTSPNSSRETLR